MAIRKTSDCNGCPECIGCSLGKYRNAVFCDSCRHEIEDKVYIVEDMHLCEEWLWRRWCSLMWRSWWAMIKEISTKNMSREEWLMHRRKAIGGSDAAAIVGLNTYSSPYEVWADKLGLVPPKEENEAMRIGHDLEDYVAKRFTEATGKRVRRKNAILYNTEIPFAHANVDRLIIGEDAGLECKTTSVLNLKKFRDGEFPPHYYVQCQHYMMVTGLPKWYLAVLVLGREFLWFEIHRNEADIVALRQAEEAFWQHVTEEKPPETDGSASCSDVIDVIYDEADPGTEADISPFRQMLIMRENLMVQISEMEEQKRAYENEIKAFLGETERGICDGYRVSWRNAERTTFDSKKYIEENPDDFVDYLKTTQYRSFRVTRMKEE